MERTGEIISYSTVIFLLLLFIWITYQAIYRTFIIPFPNIPLFFYIRKKKFYKKNINEIKRHLNNHPFFIKLTIQQQEVFASRVSDFLFLKKFIPKKMDSVSFEYKTLIAATAIQLTFGLDHYFLAHFSKIYVYPSKYYSRQKHQYHKGEINLRGAIVLSLEDFISGLKNENDGINLGLHEMAHALKFNNILTKDTDDMFRYHYNRWQQEAEVQLIKIEELFCGNSVLRDYARENIDEFFSVFIENFFERPASLKKEFPVLFEKLKLVLNIDPENPQAPGPRNSVMEKKYEKVIPVDLKLEFNPTVILPFAMALPILITGVMMISLNPYSIFSYFVLIFLFIPLSFLIKYKKYLLYGNCLVVKSFLFRNLKMEVFDFRKIDYICFRNARGGELMIKYYEDNQISDYKFIWTSDTENTALFIETIKKEGVLLAVK